MCVLQRKMTLFAAYAGLTGLVRNRIQGCIRVLFWRFLLQKYPSTFPTVKKGQVIGLADTCTLYPMQLYFACKKVDAKLVALWQLGSHRNPLWRNYTPKDERKPRRKEGGKRRRAEDWRTEEKEIRSAEKLFLVVDQ